ncbi:MAG TPA: hypothetical protein VNZ27_05960 [Rhodanobacter sp.]|jgi:general secretion pathway protein N|nr:hypothetical protein [Rhodanobacter sp.]HWX65961.1 hypothetical protein [Rhodanobacter sp.]
MNAASQRRLTPFLAAIVLLLGVLWLLLLTGVGRSVRWNAPRMLAPLPSSNKGAQLPTPLPLAQFAPVWQQSLFSPDRKPGVRAANGGSSLGDLQLTGIILTPDLRMALLHDKNGDKQVRLHEGDSLPDGSVKLVEVRQRSVLLDSSQGRTELKLPAGAPFDNQKGAAMPPAGAATGATPMQAEAPGAATMNQAPPPGNAAEQGPGRPAPLNQQQIERLRKLKAAIQKRRAASNAAANEGVR